MVNGKICVGQMKKQIRKQFRDLVFKRDKFCCRICGKRDTITPEESFDAHHITNRNEFENGGYVATNGVTLCKGGVESCHYKAEINEYSASYLYKLINSNFELAKKDDER